MGLVQQNPRSNRIPIKNGFSTIESTDLNTAPTVFDLKMHAESVHDNYKLQKCSICDFNCFQKGNLKVHTGSVHENKKSYMCSIWDYVCSQKCDLKMHT